ncbi:hypothetical protein [Teichococcus vastitatis]|uniref:hypothetical protein n=1 Tax=Teichococcus vastitatis TaxID=2307076 RepID=UPI0013006BC0|nr:hypothetical protein [Pseudoroseomonas vastitatis]
MRKLIDFVLLALPLLALVLAGIGGWYLFDSQSEINRWNALSAYATAVAGVLAVTVAVWIEVVRIRQASRDRKPLMVIQAYRLLPLINELVAETAKGQTSLAQRGYFSDLALIGVRPDPIISPSLMTEFENASGGFQHLPERGRNSAAYILGSLATYRKSIDRMNNGFNAQKPDTQAVRDLIKQLKTITDHLAILQKEVHAVIDGKR